MKVLVTGASGIVGQHMRLCVPEGITPVWLRREPDLITAGADLTRATEREAVLAGVNPDVIVNLAGEASVDKVEDNPGKYEPINVSLPVKLALWCGRNGKRFIQVSSQAVWSGENAPYGAWTNEEAEPVNAYGRQKREAEFHVRRVLSIFRDKGYTFADKACIVRLTFLLGCRPLPQVGRLNPLEEWLFCRDLKAAFGSVDLLGDVPRIRPQVADRYFSPLMAADAAALIWDTIVKPIDERAVIQCGIPERWSRHEIASLIDPEVYAAPSEDFPGIAPRPINTAYAGSRYLKPVQEGIEAARLMREPLNDRAVEIALFLGITYEAAVTKLSRGFRELHWEVTEDFRRGGSEKTNAELLDWYRSTEAYIWELSAYHLDAGFNYAGMSRGIAEGLQAHVKSGSRVLCLGDGIGDLTIAVRTAGMNAWYHDLADSKTAAFARFRIWRHFGKDAGPGLLTRTFDPPQCAEGDFDAVASLDFLEHVPNVPEWVAAIYKALRPGGVFIAQNAFAMGSGPKGAMPMHLACNDRFEKEWDDLLTATGFEQLASNWYRKK